MRSKNILFRGNWFKLNKLTSNPDDVDNTVMITIFIDVYQ